MKDTYFAHSANPAGNRHSLQEHLSSVSRLAGESLRHWKGADEARLAGLLHDLGKYGDAFQARLRGEASGLDHWSQGAWLALREYQCVAAALAIQGHHIGLQALDSLRGIDPVKLKDHHPLRLTLSDADVERLKVRLYTDGLKPEKPADNVIPPGTAPNSIAAMLDVRMLFSCLVDADFLDTEAHFQGNAQGKVYREAGLRLDPQASLVALQAFVDHQIRKLSAADPSVKTARDGLWQAASDAACQDLGVFTLTAPTGSGKTLAMLKFALEHALKHGFKRIVIAIPFLTIIEQTARIYAELFSIFGEQFVLEHHSLAGLGPERVQGDTEGDKNQSERLRRLLSQNWDAPLVITTNVQLLESLFSNRPSACRKLHSLAESVILFDEAQTLPTNLAVPTLAALSHLASTYRSSIVFATATQPAFDHLHPAVTSYVPQGWKPREIAPDHESLYEGLRRTIVQWPKPDQATPWSELAEHLRDHHQVLCVVNLKRHAFTVLKQLGDGDGVFHLSTNLCPLHRQDVLAEVRERLRSGEPCRLISTQCIEAGVDVDFPVVYRAMAPLDAIAQAAGRCNREGCLKDAQGEPKLGEVFVFNPHEDGDWQRRYPTYPYFQAAQVTQLMLKSNSGQGLDIHTPKTFRDYYQRLYSLALPELQAPDLQQAIRAAHFPDVARLYRLIDADTVMVLVPYGPQAETFRDLRDELDRRGLHAGWLRRAQRLTVNLYQPEPKHPVWGVLIPARLPRGGVSDEYFVLDDPGCYHSLLGLQLPDALKLMIA